MIQKGLKLIANKQNKCYASCAVRRLAKKQGITQQLWDLCKECATYGHIWHYTLKEGEK